MFSLNVPLAPAVDGLAADLHPKLEGFDAVRERRTLVCKRFGVADVSESGERSEDGDAEPPRRADALDRLRGRLSRPLGRTAPFEVAVTGVDTFDAPASGSAPVVYLVVESEGLVRLHERLCDAFGAIEGIEGDDYVPHVTLARGGAAEAEDAVERLLETEVEPVTWTVGELVFWDARHDEVTGRVALPG